MPRAHKNKKCRSCKKMFAVRSKYSKFCSATCQHHDWVRKNRTAVNLYQREWRNRDLNAYNKKRRNPQPFVTCKNCGETFQKHSGPHIFCSTKCRGKNQRSKPIAIKKQLLRQKRWRKNNAEKNRVYHRLYYRRKALDKMKTHPWAPLLLGAKRRAIKTRVPFSLTAKWAARVWTGKCELTGIQFSEPRKRIGYKNRNLSPSIDRKKASGGYTPKNCRFILWAINSFKRDSADSLMYRVAEALIKNKPPS